MSDSNVVVIEAPIGPRPIMPPEIAKAIVGVMSDVKKLSKDGTNTFQRYRFTSVDQFYEALGPIMASHGIFDVAIERSSEVEMREAADDRGTVKKSAWLVADYDFWLYHESGVSYGPIPRHIQVTASGAQSYASAQSFVEKYFLRNLFKVPTGDVDEADESEQRGLPEYRRNTATRPTNGNGAISGADVAELERMIKEKGGDRNVMLGHFKVESFLALTPEQFKRAKGIVEAKPNKAAVQ